MLDAAIHEAAPRVGERDQRGISSAFVDALLLAAVVDHAPAAARCTLVLEPQHGARPLVVRHEAKLGRELEVRMGLATDPRAHDDERGNHCAHAGKVPGFRSILGGELTDAAGTYPQAMSTGNRVA